MKYRFLYFFNGQGIAMKSQFNTKKINIVQLLIHGLFAETLWFSVKNTLGALHDTPFVDNINIVINSFAFGK
jgi:hypothetical protein